MNSQFAQISEPAVRQLLRGAVQEIEVMDREGLKDMLSSLAKKIVLDPANLECQIHYRIGIEGRNKLASPRGAPHYASRGVLRGQRLCHSPRHSYGRAVQ